MAFQLSGVFRIAILSPSDSVLNATKKMVELRSGSVIIAVDNKPQGILTYVLFK